MTQQDTTLSALQHYAYCRRQWGLIFLEQQWAENAHTAEGQVFHQTAHHGPEAESLRARTLSLLAELLENQARGHTPSVRAHKGCNACSLKDVCVPRLSRTGSVRAYMHARIAEDSP